MPAPTAWQASFGYNSSFKIGDMRSYVNLPVQGWIDGTDFTDANAKSMILASLLGGASYALPTVITQTMYRATNLTPPPNSTGYQNETLRFLVTSPSGVTGQALIRIPSYKGFSTQSEYDAFVANVAAEIRMFTSTDTVQFLG